MSDFQQKAAALRALGDMAIRLRQPQNCIGGDGSPSWYCSISGVEVSNGRAGLVSEYGNGSTPEAAVLDCWRALVEDVKPPRYVVLNAMGPNRRAVIWNGFMWEERPEAA